MKGFVGLLTQRLCHSLFVRVSFLRIKSRSTMLHLPLQVTAMEEMDFERRRELRRQKREEMRLEAER